jgi:hypothetical protein
VKPWTTETLPPKVITAARSEGFIRRIQAEIVS